MTPALRISESRPSADALNSATNARTDSRDERSSFMNVICDNDDDTPTRAIASWGQSVVNAVLNTTPGMSPDDRRPIGSFKERFVGKWRRY